ncbi:hypothetical protein Tco_1184442 [Tanacetum coccineum]
MEMLQKKDCTSRDPPLNELCSKWISGNNEAIKLRNDPPTNNNIALILMPIFLQVHPYIKASNTECPRIESTASKSSKEQPKDVRPSAPIIEEWESDSDDDSVFRPKHDQTKPKLTKINFVKSDENVKTVNKGNTHRQEEYPRKSQSPRDNRRN